jgi:D-glycero-D-manno-heptose 1,7-bisphosphate phosphatase
MVLNNPIEKSKKAVFLDRDGVINKMINEGGLLRSPRTQAEFEYELGIVEFANSIRDLGFEIAVITNQPEVKRGLVSREIVEQFHKKITSDTGIEHFFVCWHDVSDNCSCRKPKAGLFFDASEKLHVDLGKSYMVGDREKDMLAAQSARCEGILYSKTPDESGSHFPAYGSFNEILNKIRNSIHVV